MTNDPEVQVSQRELRERALVEQLATMNARLAAGEYQFLRLIRELEDVMVLTVDPYPRYLAWRCGMSLKTAYERVRVARALESLPAISKEFEAGRISYSKVRIVTRVATPESDAKYASLCLNGPVHFLEEVVRIHDRILHDETPHLERRRYLSMHTDDDGMVTVRGRLAPDEAAILKKALSAARTAGADDDCLALTEVAKAGVEKLATGDDAILHVENSEHICAVEGHACSRATADRLICQNPHRRKASAPQLRALKRIQGNTCAFPGCTHRRFLDAHHIVHWSKGGKTKLDNLVLICSKHHRALHEEGYSLIRANGELVFRNPWGYELKAAPVPPTVALKDRALDDIPTPPPSDLYPGEYTTHRTNLECSIEWLVMPG